MVEMFGDHVEGVEGCLDLEYSPLQEAFMRIRQQIFISFVILVQYQWLHQKHVFCRNRVLRVNTAIFTGGKARTSYKLEKEGAKHFGIYRVI